MAPPLIALLFFIVVVLVVAGVALWAIRAGLWLRETKRDAPVGDLDPTDERRGDRDERTGEPMRPQHREVHDPGKHQFFGT